MAKFQIVSPFAPAGDQPQAIESWWTACAGARRIRR